MSTEQRALQFAIQLAVILITCRAVGALMPRIGQPRVIGEALVVILIATVGKAVGCWGAARLAGLPNREALAIGALMNARGLMELVIINIGLQRGLITPTLFTVMVTMTLVTTMAAGPLFEWAWRGSAEVPDAHGVAIR